MEIIIPKAFLITSFSVCITLGLVCIGLFIIACTAKK